MSIDEGSQLWGFNAKTMAARVVSTLAKSKALLACYVRGLIEARRRRAEQEQEFYRNLKAYRHANNLPVMCGDDWNDRY
jgi:hypothetical protein